MILEPMHSNIFINHLAGGAECALGDTELGGRAEAPEGCAAVKVDLDRLEKKANRNLRKVNRGNYKVLHAEG